MKLCPHGIRIKNAIVNELVFLDARIRRYTLHDFKFQPFNFLFDTIQDLSDDRDACAYICKNDLK